MGPDGPYWNLRANGGIHSTCGDMYKWHLALEGNAVLSQEARQKFQLGNHASAPVPAIRGLARISPRLRNS